MVAYSFRPRFVDPILAGTKRQTIRSIGLRRHAMSGQQLQLYTGMRTKQCRLIGRAECLRCEGIKLSFVHHGGVITESLGHLVDLDGFARSDGFADWDDMRAFWRAEHGEPAEWSGIIVTWDHLL